MAKSNDVESKPLPVTFLVSSESAVVEVSSVTDEK